MITLVLENEHFILKSNNVILKNNDNVILENDNVILENDDAILEFFVCYILTVYSRKELNVSIAQSWLEL